MDRMGSSFEKCMKELNAAFKKTFLPLVIPIDPYSYYDVISLEKQVWKDGEVKCYDAQNDKECLKLRAEMLDALSLHDSSIMEALLGDTEPSSAEIIKSIKDLMMRREVVPVLSGSALKNVGVSTLLNYISVFIPNTLERQRYQGLGVSSDEDLKALVFKIQHLPVLGLLTYLRVYQGKIEKNMTVYNVRDKTKQRIGRVLKMHAVAPSDITSAEAGEIVAVTGQLSLMTGDTISNKRDIEPLKIIDIPKPVVSVSIEPKEKSSAALDKLASLLKLLALQDPSLEYQTIEVMPGVKDYVLKGMGELHLDIVRETLSSRYNTAVIIGPPKVEYRSTLKSARYVDKTIKHQTGGSGL
jgi:elongation factor G